MRKALVGFAALSVVAIALAETAPLAFLVLDTHGARPGQLPDGWRIKVTKGTPDVSVIRDAQGMALHFRSNRSSFGVEREVDVDPSRLPFLTWRWKVSELPRGGDFRHSHSDDEAAQVLIAFEDRRVLTYIWDSNAPKDIIQSASAIPLVHIYAVVCRSGASQINQWVTETRNIAEDYTRAYGHRPGGRVRGIRLQVNSQHTGTSAESYFGDVAFRSAP